MSSKWVTAHTDGSYSPHKGMGSWGFILKYNSRELRKTGVGAWYGDANSNRMEITAAIQALSALKRPSMVSMFTDSQYLAFTMNPQKGWKRRANKDLWTVLDQLVSAQIQVEWNWIPREMNMEADRLASFASEEKKWIDGVER